MKFSLWKQYGALNSKPVFDSFASSLKKEGHCLLWNKPGGIPVIWSVLWQGRMHANKKIWDYAKSIGQPVIVLEVGGIRRGHTWKIGINGVNRDAYFPIDKQNKNRTKQLGLNLAPWRSKGDHILICCQHEKSQQWSGQQTTNIAVKDIINQIRKHTDRDIIVRPHPRYPVKLNIPEATIEKPSKIPNTYDEYDINFNNAWTVVCHSSNPGPQAILAGIPAFVSASSLAYPVGNTDYSQIESPLMPDRTQWLNDYAHTEYTLDEIERGVPLGGIIEKLRKTYYES